MTVLSYFEKETNEFVAGGAIASDKAGLFLIANASTGVVTVNTTAKGDCVGVFDQQNDIATGEKCSVITGGRVQVQAGGTIAQGALVASNNAGKAVTFVDGFALGRALTTGANNGYVMVKLFTLQKDA